MIDKRYSLEIGESISIEWYGENVLVKGLTVTLMGPVISRSFDIRSGFGSQSDLVMALKRSLEKIGVRTLGVTNRDGSVILEPIAPRLAVFVGSPVNPTVPALVVTHALFRHFDDATKLLETHMRYTMVASSVVLHLAGNPGLTIYSVVPTADNYNALLEDVEPLKGVMEIHGPSFARPEILSRGVREFLLESMFVPFVVTSSQKSGYWTVTTREDPPPPWLLANIGHSTRVAIGNEFYLLEILSLFRVFHKSHRVALWGRIHKGVYVVLGYNLMAMPTLDSLLNEVRADIVNATGIGISFDVGPGENY